MLNTITATQLTHNTKTVIKDIILNKQPVVVLNYREPIAVIIDYKSWQELNTKKAPRLSALTRLMEGTGKKTNLTRSIRKMRNAE